MQTKTVCHWCSKVIFVDDYVDQWGDQHFCNVGCRQAQKLFDKLYNQAAYDRTAHYRRLTNKPPK